MTFAIFNSEHTVFIDSVNEAIGIVNAPRPMPGKFMFEQFRLADALVDTVALNVFYQIVNALERLAVLHLPINILLESFIREGFVH